jgi:hypothetical protein
LFGSGTRAEEAEFKEFKGCFVPDLIWMSSHEIQNSSTIAADIKQSLLLLQRSRWLLRGGGSEERGRRVLKGNLLRKHYTQTVLKLPHSQLLHSDEPQLARSPPPPPPPPPPVFKQGCNLPSVPRVT